MTLAEFRELAKSRSIYAMVHGGGCVDVSVEEAIRWAEGRFIDRESRSHPRVRVDGGGPILIGTINGEEITP